MSTKGFERTLSFSAVLTKEEKDGHSERAGRATSKGANGSLHTRFSGASKVKLGAVVTCYRGGAWPRDAPADTQASRQAKQYAHRGILIEQSVPGSLPL